MTSEQKLQKIENNQKLLVKASVRLLSELNSLKSSVDLISESLNLLLEIEQKRISENK